MAGALTVHRAGATVWYTLERPTLNLLEPGPIRTLRYIFTAPAVTLLGLPDVRVGIPSVIQSALLPLLAGPGRAAALLLTGEPVTAEQARDWGLVNEVVPAARVRTAAEALAARVLACGPDAIRLQKGLIVRWREMDLVSAVRLGIDAFAAAYATAEPRDPRGDRRRVAPARDRGGHDDAGGRLRATRAARPAGRRRRRARRAQDACRARLHAGARVQYHAHARRDAAKAPRAVSAPRLLHAHDVFRRGASAQARS